MKLLSLSIPVNLSTGEESISATILDGSESHAVSITSDHPSFSKAKENVESFQNGDITHETLAEKLYNSFVNLKQTVEEKFVRIGGVLDGRMAISGSRVTVDYEPIDPVLETHILRLLREDGSPKDAANWQAFAKFVENLYSNTSDFVRKQLFGWMAYENLNGHGLTLTSDGCIIGYKGCSGNVDNPKSINSGNAIVNGVKMNGRIPNKIGSIIEMRRSEVQDNPSIGCSAGLHVGTYAYANNFAQGVLLSVKFNPRDVVSVPTECAAQKVRVCRYEVIEAVEKAYTYATFGSASFDRDTSCVYNGKEITEDSEIAKILENAANASTSVTISYYDSNGDKTERTIRPTSVGTDRVFAFCESANGPRTFVLSRISELSEASETEESVDDEIELKIGDRVMITYDNGKSAPSVRTVVVKGVSPKTLFGYCETAEGDRSFTLKNIKSIEVLNLDANDSEYCCDCVEPLEAEPTCTCPTIEEVIEFAIDSEIDLHLSYVNNNGIASERTITPERLIDDNRVYAYCHETSSFRTFLLENIEEISVFDKDFEGSDEDPEIAEEIARNGYTDSKDPWA